MRKGRRVCVWRKLRKEMMNGRGDRVCPQSREQKGMRQGGRALARLERDAVKVWL